MPNTTPTINPFYTHSLVLGHTNADGVLEEHQVCSFYAISSDSGSYDDNGVLTSGQDILAGKMARAYLRSALPQLNKWYGPNKSFTKEDFRLIRVERDGTPSRK